MSFFFFFFNLLLSVHVEFHAAKSQELITNPGILVPFNPCCPSTLLLSISISIFHCFRILSFPMRSIYLRELEVEPRKRPLTAHRRDGMRRCGWKLAKRCSEQQRQQTVSYLRLVTEVKAKISMQV